MITIMNNPLQVLDALVSSVIVIRLMLFVREGAQHRPIVAWLAWVVISVCASVPIRTIWGYFIITDISDVIVKLILCIALIRVRGNLMQLFKVSKQHG